MESGNIINNMAFWSNLGVGPPSAKVGWLGYFVDERLPGLAHYFPGLVQAGSNRAEQTATPVKDGSLIKHIVISRNWGHDGQRKYLIRGR